MYTKNIKANWKKNFSIIWMGQALSQLSSSVLQMAIVWYLIANSNSPSIVAISGIVAFLPQGLLGPFIGVFIDRYNRKVIMILSDVLIAFASLILAIVGMQGAIPVWLIMLVLFVRSVGTAFHTPSLQAVTPLIVPKAMLTKCAGYTQTLQSASLILSPMLAAVLFAMWNLEAIIMIDVVCAILASLTLIVVNIPRGERENIEAPHVIREAKEGIDILRRSKLIGFMFLGALFNLFYMPIYVLYPMMTLSYFEKSTWHAGLVEVVFGIGMLIGALLLGIWGGTKKKIHMIAGGTLIIGICLFLSGLLSLEGFVAFVLLSALLGFVSPFIMSIQTVVFQEKIQPEFLGRVMSLSGSLMVLGTPIGIALSGFFSEYIGVEKWFFLSGILIIFTATLYWFIPSIRNCEVEQ